MATPDPPELLFEAPSLKELEPLFPAYTLEAFVAQGGMGAVYQARQKSLDRRVAIKILPRQFGSDPQFHSSFASEAKAMARLNHPNLIGVYDFGEVDGMLFIVMEMVQGKSLFHSAHGKAIVPAEAVRIVSGICHGLAHAHQAGILHRDIKPSNILLDPSANPKIGDFGLARPVGEGHGPNEVVFGTPGYAAPEVLQGAAVDERTDLFAVGVILYELLTGRLPSEPWRPPTALAKCDPAFDTIVRRATHPSPSLRYGSAEEMAQDLEAVQTQSSGARTLLSPTAAHSTTPTVPANPASARSAPTIHPNIPARPKSNAGPVALFGLLALVAISTAVFFATRSRPEERVEASVSPPTLDPIPEPEEPAPKPPAIAERSPAPSPLPEPSPQPEPEPDPEPEPKVESLQEALARLKPRLRQADFSELPPGTVSHAGSHFLVVSDELDWRSAWRFAEDHGAQLAVFSTSEDLEWAGKQFEMKSPLWLGLADSGTEGRWYWVDGIPTSKELWAVGQPNNSPSRDDGEDFAALLPGVAQLDDFAGSRPYPFLLQWAEDGDNRGALQNQLKRTADALRKREVPLFPAGTRNIEGSRFLLVPHRSSWEEASALATAAGGHLAVPSSTAEALWISDQLRPLLEPGQACWVGGILDGESEGWRFVTGEKFEFVTWAPSQPDGADADQPYLQVWRSGTSPSFGYNDAKGADEVRYYLLEWSAPSKRNMPGTEELAKGNPTDVVEWLANLRESIREKHQAGYKKFGKKWHKNFEDFVDDVSDEVDDSQFPGLKRIAEDFLNGLLADEVVPEELPPATPRPIRDIHEKALQQQRAIWKDYEPEFNLALSEYLESIDTQVKKLTAARREEDAAYLKREHEATSADHERFHAIQRGEDPPVPEAGGGD